MKQPMLSIHNLSKTYAGGKKAVDDLTLEVERGDLYAFIGHNGAGKTTTIRALMGILDFEEGEIRIGGHSIKEEPVRCKEMTAYLPDNPDLYGYLTGLQYLHYMADLFQVSEADREARILEYSTLLELEGVLSDPISSYSHGMKQKLALIGAFIHRPKLIVLDEPFVGLDPKAAFHLKCKMRELCAEGNAIFFSTHVLDVAEKLCNKVAIIHEGRLVCSGTLDEVKGSGSLESAFLEVMDHE